MVTSECTVQTVSTPSIVAKSRLLSRSGEPLFVASWERVFMIHFEVDARTLQEDVPYELDLMDGRAFISLVAFTMRGLKLHNGGRFFNWMLKPIATHDFLNVRTYVRHGDEIGIHFLAEWLSNRLAVLLGPRTFSLPYRYGLISYHHDFSNTELHGRVENGVNGLTFDYCARAKEDHTHGFVPCEPGSLDDWLMERYTAFNSVGQRRRFFRVWHPPWQQCQVDVKLNCRCLLNKNWNWFRDAHLVGANYSPGFREVWTGRPHKVLFANENSAPHPARRTYECANSTF